MAEAGPAFLALVREVCAQGRPEESIVNALCEPPEVFTYGGIIAPLLGFASYRRTLVVGALQRAGISGLGFGDRQSGWFSTMSDAQLLTVNVVYEIRPGAGPGRDTAIDKRPVIGPVMAGELGLTGDTQCVRSHGGVDKALYAYASEDSAWWAAALDREIPPGLFGENLTTAGLDVTHALIGEVWQIGAPGRGPLVEVRMPRTPCENLSARMEMPEFHKRFNATGRVGAMLRVRSPGPLAAGDPVVVTHRPDHDVTLADWSANRSADHARRLLDSGTRLAEPVRRAATRLVARAARR